MQSVIVACKSTSDQKLLMDVYGILTSNFARARRRKCRFDTILADKSIADVCEALIGAAYLNGRTDGDMDMAVRAVSKMVRSKNHKMESFDEYYEAFKVPAWQTEASTATRRFPHISDMDSYHARLALCLCDSRGHA